MLLPVLRSRLFYGWHRLRLQKSEVPEQTQAPTKLGRLRAKKRAAPTPSPAPDTKNCHFELK